MINSADPDQLASSQASLSGSTLFAKTGHVMFSKRRVSFTKCPKIANTLFQDFLLFSCLCFAKHLMEWQTVQTLIRQLLWSDLGCTVCIRLGRKVCVQNFRTVTVS